MKENKLTEEEKYMYGICFNTLIIGAILLLLLGFDTPNTITGAVVGAVIFEDNDQFSYEDIVDYENISLENITQEMALNAILQAEKDIQELQEAGFGINWFNDTLIETKKYFKGKNYTALLKKIDEIENEERREEAKQLLLEAQETIGVSVDYKKVLEKTKAINERKKKAFEINDLIRASQLRIQEFKQQGLDTSKVEETLGLNILDTITGVVFYEQISVYKPIYEERASIDNAVDEFKNERFENAEDILNTIDGELIELSAETTIVKTIYRAGKENITSFIKDRYRELLLLLGSLLVIAILLYNRIMIAILRHRIKDMKVEKDVLLDLMKESQKDYFVKGDITGETFKINISNYEKRFVELKQKLPVAEALLEKRLKSKRVL